MSANSIAGAGAEAPDLTSMRSCGDSICSTPTSPTNAMMVPQTLKSRRYLFGALVILVLFVLYAIRLSFESSGISIQIVRTSAPAGAINPPEQADSTLGPVAITKNVAAIIENRPLDGVVPLLLHFAAVLGPEWPIFLFTTQKTTPNSAPFKRLIDERRLAVTFLPLSTDFKSREDVSNFLTKPWLYEQLVPAGHILLFQSDSVLCAQSSLKVDDFLEYDFVGAPIDKQYGEGYNGGLSLRNRTMALDIIKQSDWKAELDNAENPTVPTVQFEDQWFYKKIKEYPGSRLPSVDVAKTFSVETIWYDKPLGYHQVTRWHNERIKEVDLWCPEHRMASNELLVQ